LQTKLSSPAKEHELVAAYMEAGTIYVFADKVQDMVTKNEMLARVIELARTPDETIIPGGKRHYLAFVSGLVILVYERTPELCSIIKLLVDLRSNVHEQTIRNTFKKLPGEFLGDLLLARLVPNKPNIAKQNGHQEYLEEVRYA
jgi:hypothetical protein